MRAHPHNAPPLADPSPNTGARGGGAVISPVRHFTDTVCRHRVWLWVGVSLLYLASFNGQWRITPDSADYLIVAKTFADQGRLSHPFDFADHNGPGFPLMMGYLIRLAGPDGFWALDLAMLLLVPINLALVYWLFSLYTDAKSAVVVTLLTAVAQVFYSSAFYLLADGPFLTGALVYLVGLGYLEKHPGRYGCWVPLMASGLLGMACMRTVFFVFPLATLIGLTIAWLTQRRLAHLARAGAVMAGLTAVAVFVVPASSVAWMRGDAMMMRRYLIERLPETVAQAVTENGFVFLGNVLPRAALGVDLGPWLNLVLSGLLLAGVLRLVRTNPVWALVIVCFFAQAVLFFTSQRFLLPALPLLAFAWWGLASAIGVWALGLAGRRSWARGVAVGMLWFWVAANLIKIGGFAVEQHAQPFWDRFNHGRYAGFGQACGVVRRHTPGNSLVMTQSKWVGPMMYMTQRIAADSPSPRLADGRPVYAVLPLDEHQLPALEHHGWRLRGEDAVAIEQEAVPGISLTPVDVPVGLSQHMP